MNEFRRPPYDESGREAWKYQFNRRTPTDIIKELKLTGCQREVLDLLSDRKWHSIRDAGDLAYSLRDHISRIHKKSIAEYGKSCIEKGQLRYKPFGKSWKTIRKYRINLDV
ncbi:MAG: hypothetical protein GY861_18550 [bacterium]|nr:hypothetical protein [bacterium]